ncbi:MAG: ATP-binding protein [Terriglobia bacterium]
MAKTRVTSAIIPSVLKLSRWQIPRFVAAAGMVLAIVLIFRQVVPANPTSVARVFLLAILYVSAFWGLRVSIFMSLLATLAFNYYFLPPLGSLTIADPQNWVALTAFLITAITASRLSEQARQRARDANRRRQEIERLYAFTQQMLVAGGVVELLNAIPRHIVESFEVQDAALYLASREAIYRSGRDFRELDGEQLKAVMARGEPVVEADRQLCCVPVRMGVRPVGSLGISGAVLARETLEALGTLIAITVERVSAIEALGKAEAARQEERLRSALLDSVTHELRTPLTAIKASVTSLLTQSELSDAQRQELFSIINEESDHLNHLIEEALEMARLDAGEIELEIEPHAILEVIDAGLEASKNVLANHTVDVRLPEGLPTVPMDPARIREVLTQLLDNAAKFSPPGAPILISSEVSGRFLVTSVADRGPGIDSFEQALIFDKFYRGRDQRYRVQGTGMGLAICKAIVEAHGGSIGVTSQVGSGSVFHFNLPLSPERARVL